MIKGFHILRLSQIGNVGPDVIKNVSEAFETREAAEAALEERVNDKNHSYHYKHGYHYGHFMITELYFRDK